MRVVSSDLNRLPEGSFPPAGPFYGSLTKAADKIRLPPWRVVVYEPIQPNKGGSGWRDTGAERPGQCQERRMSYRYALARLAVGAYSSARVQGWRNYLSALLAPFWPVTDEAGMKTVVVADQPEGWHWRRLDGALEINAGSGGLFQAGRRIKREMAPDCAIFPAAAADLTGYLGGKVIPREPALVLYAGAATGIGAFAADLLPRFFALDRLGVPEDALLLVTLGMGRQGFFQDALADGVFRPRPVELLRPGSLIRTDCVHEISVPMPDRRLLEAISAKMAALFGPYESDGPPVLLCRGGAAPAGRLIARLDRSAALPDRTALRVLDPEVTPLRVLVRSIAAARAIIAPDNGDLAALLLAPNRERRAIEIGRATPQVRAIAEALGETHQATA